MIARSLDLFADPAGADLGSPPPGLRTLGELDLWLDGKPDAALLAYTMHGAGNVERLACLRAIIRREVRHQMRHHPVSERDP